MFNNYSVYIHKQVETGAIYEDAVDVLPLRYSYEETDTDIEREEGKEDEGIY